MPSSLYVCFPANKTKLIAHNQGSGGSGSAASGGGSGVGGVGPLLAVHEKKPTAATSVCGVQTVCAPGAGISWRLPIVIFYLC